ncbi:MAG: DUF1295 domain-containing protein [Spirochaetia bacterium]|nr:DUF1295 domain-containing protein [Spirochaetia bacterium]
MGIKNIIFYLHCSSLFAAVLFWSGRLTINWALNWKGLQDEDWRYVGFRRSFPRSYWLVSFAAIHLFPTMMVFIACIPAHNVLVNGLQRSSVFLWLFRSCDYAAWYYT